MPHGHAAPARHTTAGASTGAWWASQHEHRARSQHDALPIAPDRTGDAAKGRRRAVRQAEAAELRTRAVAHARPPRPTATQPRHAHRHARRLRHLTNPHSGTRGTLTRDTHSRALPHRHAPRHRHEDKAVGGGYAAPHPRLNGRARRRRHPRHPPTRRNQTCRTPGVAARNGRPTISMGRSLACSLRPRTHALTAAAPAR